MFKKLLRIYSYSHSKESFPKILTETFQNAEILGMISDIKTFPRQ